MDHVLGQRSVLLALARSRVVCVADAEDAVQETLLRALERVDELDPARVDGWLKTVTMNICRDMGRERGRHRQRVAYQVRQVLPEPYVDEAVAERAYAVDVARHMQQLPEAQQSVLQMRADALPVEEIASRLGLTAKSAESLLSRGRRTMRTVASSLQAVLVWVWVRRRPRRGIGQAATGFAATGALAVAAVVACAPPATPEVGASGRTTAVRDVLNPAVASHPLKAPVSRPRVGVQPPRSVPRPAARPRTHLHAGPVDVQGGDVSRRKPDETFVQSVEDCVSEGVTVSLSYIGCDAAQ